MMPHPVYDAPAIEQQVAAAEAEQAAIEHLKVLEAPDLTAESILGAEDVGMIRVYVPEWGGHVHIRQLSGWERDRFEASVSPAPGGKKRLDNFRARFAAEILCDKDGKKLFEFKDVEALGRKSGKALDRVFEAGAEFNGLGKKDVEELEKN